jgi:hypothetical protein
MRAVLGVGKRISDEIDSDSEIIKKKEKKRRREQFKELSSTEDGARAATEKKHRH